MSTPSAPRGVPDRLPPVSELLNRVEGVARALFDRNGYRRLDTPLFEHVELFERSEGGASEIVLDKQMYTFTDRRDRAFALRPEGTPGVARAWIEHKLSGAVGVGRYHYIGPFFRYERPQKGRTRQFEQAGAECLGSSAPVVDAELIVMAWRFFAAIDLHPHLNLNSMGCPGDRTRYHAVLRAALADVRDDMCDDCHQRLETNPLRVWDCKVDTCREILRGGDVPFITEHLCDDCRRHHADVQSILEELGVAWTDAPDLVRGLDYYTRTVFEFDLPDLGGRPTVAAGGRYDGLIEQLGGPATPAAGFAIGLEPVLVALTERAAPQEWSPDVYIVWLEGLAGLALATATDLRGAGLRVTMSTEPRKIGAQIKAADRDGARTVVILGPDEVSKGVATVRDLETGDQREVDLEALTTVLAE